MVALRAELMQHDIPEPDIRTVNGQLAGGRTVPPADLAAYLKRITPTSSKPGPWDSFNYWSNTPKFAISFLKAMYGDAATKQNDFAFHYLPKIDRNYSWVEIWDGMYRGAVKGMFAFGMNGVMIGPDQQKNIAALKKAAADGIKLQNIRSVEGFERRLNDATCSGCHQTRGIGGFHFPGVDWMAAKPSNSTVVPASPHFFGDQIRRRDILASLRDGKTPDYSRGFASRPQLRGSTELAGTNYYDGWGAHCYVQGKPAASNDESFRGWTCAEGLSCQATGKISRIGMCFVKSR